jgi:hypothetical protein
MARGITLKRSVAALDEETGRYILPRFAVCDEGGVLCYLLAAVSQLRPDYQRKLLLESTCPAEASS